MTLFVLLIDADNAFNSMNRMVALHNVRIICPAISIYLRITYRTQSKLFVAGGIVMFSKEGTTQGDPMAMPWYALSTTVLINKLRSDCSSVSQVWLADDASGAGKIRQLFEWFCVLDNDGAGFGYHVNGKKSWLIVKSEAMIEEARKIFGTSVNITCEGKRHLGAVLGSETFRKEYCDGIVNGWVNELTVLCQIAESQPQAAYAAFKFGYQSKFTYFLRTIEDFQLYTEPVDSILTEKLIVI